MKRYHDIVGDGGSRILEQVAEQRTRITDGLAGVRHLVAVGSGKGGVGKSTLTPALPALSERAARVEGSEDPSGAAAGMRVEGFVIPVTVDDLAANGPLAEADAEAGKRWCWERSVETLTARKDDIAGLAVASDERIEAYLLYVKPAEIVSLRSFTEDGGARLKQLLARLDTGTFRFPKVHPAEISTEFMEMLGFRPAGGHLLYAATLRPFEKLRAPRATSRRDSAQGRPEHRRGARVRSGSPDDRND